MATSLLVAVVGLCIVLVLPLALFESTSEQRTTSDATLVCPRCGALDGVLVPYVSEVPTALDRAAMHEIPLAVVARDEPSA